MAVRHRVRLPGGGERWVEQSLEPVRSYQKTIGLRGTLRDITAQRASDRDVRQQHSHDPLTGLASRSVVLESTREAMTEALKERRSVALLHVSLDRFRSVNQMLGHAFGERSLQHGAE